MNKTKRSSIGKSLLCGLIGALGLILLFSAGAFAQANSSGISGFVKDPSGAVIPGVTVTVKLEGGGLVRSAVTDQRGYYVITPLPSGFYNVSVEHTGFKRAETTGKSLDPGIPGALDIVLQVGGTSETITVTANTATVQTESATVGKLVEGTQLQYLGLNGRNPIYLAGLMPGVSTDLAGNNYGSSTPPSMNGSSLGMIFFDGMVGVRTRANGTWSIGAADMDSTQEVQVLTANFSAEYGRTAGGQIRIVTRGGASQFHGSVYDYIRNSAFNANSWSRNNSTLQVTAPCSNPANYAASYCRPSPFRYNQYGWNFSGPVLLPFTTFNRDRSKLFFMFSQEWVHSRSGSTTTMTVASDKMRQGDFSELLDPTNRFFQRAIYLKDPLKTGTCSAASQVACFNYNGIVNYIPPDRLSPNGMAFMRAYPEPKGYLNPYPSSTNWWSGENAGGTDQGKTTIAADYTPAPSHSIRIRGQFFNSHPPQAVIDYTNKFYTWP
ncbi:MAG: carboxypeptidase regulatory-like domain-containing protein, partial [Acidobacteriota bacterium]